MIDTYKLYLTIVSACMVVLSSLTGCQTDEAENAERKAKRLLSAHTWKVDKVIVDGVDKTALYFDMTLAVSSRTYTSKNGEPVWPVMGSWTLEDHVTINRDNGLMVHIELLNDNKLILSLEWTKTTYSVEGRTHSISGFHTFEMSSQ
jgi:hypothetical protein